VKGANQAVSLIPSLSCSMCWLHAALAKIAGLAWTAVEGVERFSRKVPPVTVKRGDTRINAVCGRCGGINRVSAAQGELRVQFTLQGMWAQTEDSVI
jgi:hypothetical protein